MEKTRDPCRSQLKFVERLVRVLKDEEDSVFSSYVDVRTTEVVALNQDWLGVGCKIMREYVDLSQERLEILEVGSLRTFRMGKPSSDPSLPIGGH